MHELTSEVSLRKKCAVKIMAMPGSRAAMADLCMFGLAACGGGPGFVNASVRTTTNARQVGVRLQSKCTSTHRHARDSADNPTEKGEQTRTRKSQVAQALEEQLKRDQQELETRATKRKGGRGCAGKTTKQDTEPHATRNGQTHAL